MSDVKSDDFCHFHTHSEYSTLDGCGKMHDFMTAAKAMGQPAIAFTEHGTVRQLTRLHKEIEENPDDVVRPIYGVELYLCKDMARRGMTPEEKARVTDNLPKSLHKEAIKKFEHDEGITGRYHLTVLAKDSVGLKNLMRVTTLGWVKGFYRRPRVDLDCLLANHEGLVVLSGCQIGSIGSDYLDGKPGGAIDKVTRLRETFGDDFYGEVMPHNMPDQVRVNKATIALSKRFGMSLIATQDAHYIAEDDWKYQEAMLCLHSHTTLSDPNRWTFTTHDFWLKPRAAMAESFRQFHPYMTDAQVQGALDTTMELESKLQAKLEVDRFKALVPKVSIPPEFSDDENKYIRSLCLRGWKERDIDRLIVAEAARRRISIGDCRKIYMDRLRYELERMEAQKVTRYMLVVWDVYKWARAAKIECGPARGSAGGSLVSFLLGITDLDPIMFGLLFERFLSPDRIDLPDVDMDFEDARRDEVITFLHKRYGEDNASQIGTNNKLTGKGCLRDIARIMDIPLREIQPVVDAVVERSSGDERASMTIEDSFKEFPVCQRFNERYPEVLEYAKKLEGQVKALGVHAAGVVVSPVPLIDVVPLEIRSQKGDGTPKVVTAVDMYGVSDLGLVKMDILGIRNLSAMRFCREAVAERHGVEIDWLKLPLDDKPTLANFTNHHYIGIFQFDTVSADKICDGVEFTSFDDVSAMVALDRPGTARSGLATEYLKRKKDPKKIVSIHPLVDEICKDTLGVIVYQEHVMKIFTDVAGFSPATSDSLRRKIAKKYGDDAIAKERENFVKGAIEHGLTPELASKLIEQIKFFGSYGFNKAHSVAYGLIAYREMYLKTHYPMEFMWALLKVEPDTDKVIRMVRACKRMGIDVLMPDINSKDPCNWTIEGGAIVGAVSNIKGVGEAAVRAIAAAGPYKDFVDFAERVDRRRCHKGVVNALIQGGAFDRMVPNTKWLYENLEKLWVHVGKANKGWQDKLRAIIRASAAAPKWPADVAEDIAKRINPMACGEDPLAPYVPMIEGMRTVWMKMDDEAIWDNPDAWMWGRIIEVRQNQVGDFHSGEEPSDEDKAKMGWGKRYANINVEDMSGRNQRVKIDVSDYEIYRPLLERGAGTVVAGHVVINKQYHSMRASFLVDLDELKAKIGAEDQGATSPGFDPLELCLWDGWRPGGKHVLPICEDRIWKMSALVVRVMQKTDKKGNEMGFLGLIGSDGLHRECLCFASSWESFQQILHRGVIAKFKLTKEKRTYFLDNKIEAAVTVIEP